MIVFAHTTFGSVRKQGSEVKRGGGEERNSSPSLSEFLKSRSGQG